MSLATVSIVGNLVKDPEQYSFPSGRTKTRIVVAVNTPSRTNKGTDEADFYKVEAWGKLGELSANYLAKGNQVTVCGRLVFERWTDKEGRARQTPLIEANQISFPRRLKLVEFNGDATGHKLDDIDHEMGDEIPHEMRDEMPMDGSGEVADFNAAAAILNGRTAKGESRSPRRASSG